MPMNEAKPLHVANSMMNRKVTCHASFGAAGPLTGSNRLGWIRTIRVEESKLLFGIELRDQKLIREVLAQDFHLGWGSY